MVSRYESKSAMKALFVRIGIDHVYGGWNALVDCGASEQRPSNARLGRCTWWRGKRESS
jgi:hypothetical protein